MSILGDLRRHRFCDGEVRREKREGGYGNRLGCRNDRLQDLPRPHQVGVRKGELFIYSFSFFYS